MANRLFSNVRPMPKGNPSGRPSFARPRGRAPMPEKAAFPSAALPGKTQPRDRSAGVKRAKVGPNRKGL